MEQCREVYSALVHTVPDLWMRRGFSLRYYKQHAPCRQHGPAPTGERLGTRKGCPVGQAAVRQEPRFTTAAWAREGRSLTRDTEPKPPSGHDQSCPPLANDSPALGNCQRKQL